MSDETPFPPPPPDSPRDGGFRSGAPQGSSFFNQQGPVKPRIRPAAITGEGAPLGMSLTPPTPAPLPERGAGVFLLINLVAAIVALTFTLLIALKL